jgi:hypothetical protein
MSVVFKKILLPVILFLSAVIAVYTMFEISQGNKEIADRPDLIKSDYESIERGRNIFDSKCRFCHDAYSTGTIVGPGLKGIMKKEILPFSKRLSTPENIIRQLKKPVDRMPAFEYLSEEDYVYILAFLYTL